jgi:hypothetical protein
LLSAWNMFLGVDNAMLANSWKNVDKLLKKMSDPIYNMQ